MNKLNVLYEDNHIIVVEKKPNILSQSDYTKDLDLLTMVKNYLKEKYQKPGNVYLGLVHCLDRPVGGIMVFAKTSKAARRLSDAIKNHEMMKEYLLVCHNKLSKTGVMEDYLKKLDKKSVVTTEKDGKYSKLEYEVLQVKNNLNLVTVTLNDGNDFKDHVNLFEYGFSNYINEPVLTKGALNVYDEVYYGNYFLSIDNDFSYPITKDENIFLKFELDKEPDEGVVGLVKVLVNNEEVYRDNIKAVKIETHTKGLMNWFRNIW